MQQKIADYILDIAKLVFAGVVLGGIFRIATLAQPTMVLLGVTATIILALIGFILVRK